MKQALAELVRMHPDKVAPAQRVLNLFGQSGGVRARENVARQALALVPFTNRATTSTKDSGVPRACVMNPQVEYTMASERDEWALGPKAAAPQQPRRRFSGQQLAPSVAGAVAEAGKSLSTAEAVTAAAKAEAGTSLVRTGGGERSTNAA